MKEELNSIVQIIEEHFSKEVWNSEPPIKDIDYKLAIIAIKIYEVKAKIDEIDDIDKVISDIVNYMEHNFEIPLHDKDKSTWLKKDKIRHQVVIEVYKRLSNNSSL